MATLNPAECRREAAVLAVPNCTCYATSGSFGRFGFQAGMNWNYGL